MWLGSVLGRTSSVPAEEMLVSFKDLFGFLQLALGPNSARYSIPRSCPSLYGTYLATTPAASSAQLPPRISQVVLAGQAPPQNTN